MEPDWYQYYRSTCQVDSNYYVVTTVGYFSKYVHAIPSHHKSAAEVGDFSFSFMCCYGCSDIHTTDKGTKFINKG